MERYTKSVILAVAFVLGALLGEANAAVTFIVSKSGNNLVVSSTGGSFNLDNSSHLASFTPKLSQIRFTLQNNNDAVYIGTGVSDYYRVTFQGPTPVVTTNINQSANTTTGAFYGAYLSNNLIFVPRGYSSGDVLPYSSATYYNTTLSDWGLQDGGKFTWSWGTGASADSVTVAVLPEPSSTLLVVLGLSTLAAQRRRITGSSRAIHNS